MKTLTKLSLPAVAASLLLAFGTSNSIAQPIFPVAYIDLVPGQSADGITPIPLQRQDPDNAVGAPQESDIDFGETAGNTSSVNYYSLGFGGSITLVFAQPFGQGEGTDLIIFETTYNTPPCSQWPELADVFISQDGCNWIQVADDACQNIEIELPDNMPWALYVRIEDASNSANFNGADDGYDVDGIRANYVSNVNPLAPGTPFGASFVHNYIPGNIKNNSALVPMARRNSNLALGLPQGNDVINFVSLGFDNPNTEELEGQIILGFDYTVFDKTGADIKVVETTFRDRATRTCENYPEIAEFYGSNDGISWTLLAAASVEPAFLSAGQLCRDGDLDISAMPGGTLRYLKIIDRSIRISNRFPGNADAYDVDGVVVYPCGPFGEGKISLSDNENTPDEDGNMFMLGIFPNPASKVITLNLETYSSNENYTIRIFDITGRVVSSSNLNAAANSNILTDISIEQLPTGVYTVSVESSNHRQVSKFVKH